ncbi:MAG: VWA domain-containing protein, partial [Vallitaleaceae bacterium]|nr:VWA domain-containing protein [Vallitaleaceae bacterium]
MNGKNNSIRAIIILGVIGVLVFAIIYGGISATKNVGKSKTVVTAEKAIKTMNKLYDDIDVSTETPRKVPVSLEAASVKEALPEISKYPAQVDNTTDTYVEIFSSTEKTGEGKDGWLIDMANAFNSSGAQVGGKTATVRIRGIASGTGTDYITSGKYLPDAFTPSNELWGKMIEAQGTKINLVEDRLTGNVAGVLMSKTKYN